ncbi:hypothetical protein GCM10025792_22640 [Pseudonocardia tropica]
MLRRTVLCGSGYPVLTPDRWPADLEAPETRPEVRPMILEDKRGTDARTGMTGVGPAAVSAGGAGGRVVRTGSRMDCRGPRRCRSEPCVEPVPDAVDTIG